MSNAKQSSKQSSQLRVKERGVGSGRREKGVGEGRRRREKGEARIERGSSPRL